MLTKLLRPYFDIYLGRSLYMRRWWLFGSEQARDQGEITCGVHHIVRPDADRDMHTHPCTFISLVFWGWYLERLPRHQSQAYERDAIDYVVRLRFPLSVAVRRSTDRHMITNVSPRGAWTVILWLRKQGSWGFCQQTDNRFVPWREYQRGTENEAGR